MPGDITFATNRYDIESKFYPVLNSVVDVLKHYNQTYIEVGGYTDSTGSLGNNQQLSVQRAQSVGNYLAAQGVQAGRIKAIGYGESHPIGNNNTASGRAMNRRVTITLIPVTS